MKKILLFGVALLAMVSCEKYDDSDVWNAINDLKAKQENASKEGVTPVVKTVNEEMFISYDNGTTWTKMSNGMYSEISYDERYVVFTLTDGTELKVLNANYVVPIEKGAIKAAFSVAEGKQVYFSQGNLQYQASTGVWRFATNQWEAIGEGNANIAPDYDGWIDLFGWGTSGWNSGAVCYQPYSTTKNALQYNEFYPGGLVENDLVGKYANADWGIYNKINNGGNQENMWRVLSNSEWQYLIKYRENASSKRLLACVNGINGLVLFPDDFVFSQYSTLSFAPIINIGSEVKDDLLFAATNNFTLSQWLELEDFGAIFLPVTGSRQYQKPIFYSKTFGSYWSSTYYSENCSCCMKFYSNGIQSDFYGDRSYGRAVRLVQDVK